MADKAVGTIQGSSTTARMKVLAGIALFSSKASHSPSMNLKILAMIV